MAVNEETGELIQVTEGGYIGMLNIARNSMKLYFMRNPNPQSTTLQVTVILRTEARPYHCKLWK
jgi:hypothetical protein